MVRGRFGVKRFVLKGVRFQSFEDKALLGLSPSI